MIQLNEISKSYAKSKNKAVDNLSLTVPDGEIFGFLGPNGAGKTTTIKLLTGILKPDFGTVSIDGLGLAANPLGAKQRLGYVSDNPELFARLKAWEYLNFVADVYKVSSSERQERISNYAGLFGIRDVLHGSIGSFSHGMKQKLLLTASLLHDPANWILDEPMVGLDPKSAFQLKELMRQRSKAGKTVFFSTHVMEVAEKLCDRIAIINKGSIVFLGTVAALQEERGAGSSLENLFLQLVGDESGVEA